MGTAYVGETADDLAVLGLDGLPRYSLLVASRDQGKVKAAIRLAERGIRVFVIAPAQDAGLPPDLLAALEQARIVEWSRTEVTADFVVRDGKIPSGLKADVARSLEAADNAGGVNASQYEIVHWPADKHILVNAGAGTGKTESMTERLLFLLSTVEGFRLDEVVMMTFTREAAAQMRDRLARSLLLRQRLCARNQLPTLQWMMELAGAEIWTIHTLAKRIVQRGGADVGLPQDFRVSALTMEFREMLARHLEQGYTRLLAEKGQDDSQVPPLHEWVRHIETVWDLLDNNGVELISLSGAPDIDKSVDWGKGVKGGQSQLVADTVRDVICGVSAEMSALCLARHVLPVSQLVSTAMMVLDGTTMPFRAAPKFVFVDEFQDSDQQQIQFILGIQGKCDARLFVVGDPKQAIYRFRGAKSDAFTMFQALVPGGIEEPARKLVRNFRSGQVLLDSLHPYFDDWGSGGRGFLEYDDTRRLLPDPRRLGQGLETEIVKASPGEETRILLGRIAQWRGEDEDSTLAIICRTNEEAHRYRKALQDHGHACEISVGGDFFRSPAVREFRTFLYAIVNRHETGALLEVCDTRWAHGLLGSTVPDGLSKDDSDEWGVAKSPHLSWGSRFGAVATTGEVDVSDLSDLRRRLNILSRLPLRQPLLTWLVACTKAFTPERTGTDDDVDKGERSRYFRCLSHLLTLISAEVEKGTLTVEALLQWLVLQIAVNKSEDEPFGADEAKGKTTAITVHKAKGLEFDRVFIPRTTHGFIASSYRDTQTGLAMSDDGSGRIRPLWKWKGRNGFTNVPDQDQHLWDEDGAETEREETRLLYVAMTRAREELVICVDPEAKPQTWGHLLGLGE